MNPSLNCQTKTLAQSLRQAQTDCVCHIEPVEIYAQASYLNGI